MFNNLKYLELTRHHIYTKTKRTINDYAKQKNGSGLNKLSEAVFSSALSVLLTYLVETYVKDSTKEVPNVWATVALFAAAIVLYCALYICIRKIYSIIAKVIENHSYNKRIHSPEITAQKTKELIDDFDHIAFDHLIIAYEFLNEIELSTNLEVRTFYFHEALYYLRTSINITKEVTQQDRRKDCLNIFGNVNGIDVFRLKNAHKMMCDLCSKIKEILGKRATEPRIIQLYDDCLSDILSFQISELDADIDEIGKRCIDALTDIRPAF